MKCFEKILSVAFSIVMILMLLPCSAAAEQTAEEPSAGAAAGDRIILTIGDMSTRSGNRYNEEKGMWRYLAERLGVDIRYDYIPPEEFSSRLASGDLPDIVATDKNLSTILEYGVALDAQVDLILAETDEEWEAIRDKKILELAELGEPEVFRVYQKMWNDAAEVIVPIVHQVQTRNGVTPYTPEEYADHLGAGKGEQESEDQYKDGTEVQEP